MTDQQWNIALPPNLVFTGDYTIEVQAVHPTTGAPVPGVQIRRMALQVDQLGGGSLEFGPFMLVTGPSG